MATSLPFETRPELEEVVLGNERTGTLKFPVYNDLTVQEQAWMAAEGSRKTAFSETSRVALKIARIKKVKPIDSHTFVARVLSASMGAEIEFTETDMAWQVEFVRDLEELAFRVLEISVAQQQMLVTAVIRHRLKGMTAWTLADTANMSSELCEEIYTFAMKEQSRGQSEDPVQEAVEELTEMLGKSKTEPTKTEKPSTGRKRSTRSATSTPAKKSSVEKTSDDSPADTSSTASSKESS